MLHIKTNDEYAEEIYQASGGYSIAELIKRFNQGYSLESPVQQLRNVRNNNEALVLRAIVEDLKQYVDNLGSDYNYEHAFGTRESSERAWDCYTVARNIEIRIKDILKEYGVKI